MTSKPQSVAIHTHQASKLFYVGIYNTKTAKTSSSMNANYNRAQFLYKQMLEGGDARGLKSGFMMGLINTNFEGWETEIVANEITNDEAIEMKKDSIEELSETMTYIGSDRIFVKGDVRNIESFDSSWTRKWNIENMTQVKIKDKIIFILKSFDENVPNSIYSDGYMCIVNEEHMARKHNFEPFVIDDLVTLYKYVRLYLGYDLQKG